MYVPSRCSSTACSGFEDVGECSRLKLKRQRTYNNGIDDVNVANMITKSVGMNFSVEMIHNLTVSIRQYERLR